MTNKNTEEETKTTELFEHKRDLLVEILKKLSPYRDLAIPITALVESEYMDEKTLDTMLAFISKAIQTLESEQVKEKFIRSIEQIQKAKTNEELSKLKDEMDFLND